MQLVAVDMYYVCTCCNAQVMLWWNESTMFCPNCDMTHVMTIEEKEYE